MGKRIIVAIDGPAGAGKSTIARRIATKLGLLYLDSGAMYRAIAWWALENGTALSDVAHLEQLAESARVELDDGRVVLNGTDITALIRSPEVTAAASQVAAVAGVRRALVTLQRAYGARGSVVMEGRDIGSVVFPEADVKIFLDASTAERARRRATESNADPEMTAGDIAARDKRDRTRRDSPLVQAPDAIYVDTDGRNLDEVEASILKLIRDRTSNGKEFHR